jgi:[ribosomal protein S5]-alanine N-acetyltransferase
MFRYVGQAGSGPLMSNVRHRKSMSESAYVFCTPRLGLRHFVPSDAEQLAAVFGDPYAQEFYPAMSQPDALERWVTLNLRNYAEFGFGLLAVELLASGIFIGDAGVTFQNFEDRRIHEVGWHIHPAYRNLGYATEAGLASLAYAFSTLKAPLVGSIVDPRNYASRKVAARVHTSSREFAGKSGSMLLYFTLGRSKRSDA